MSLLNVILFFGGWLSPIYFLPDSSIWLAIKTALFVFAFIWVRASFPRIRYDQLMQLLWKNYLPLSLGFVVFISSLLTI
jgi:NADH:ubiquinone oxidoreductase subunit H